MASNNAKTTVFFIIVLILISLFLAGGSYYLLQKERSEKLALKEELEDLKTKHKATVLELGESKTKVIGLQANLSEAQVKVNSLMSNLEKEKSARQEALIQISQLNVNLEEQNSLKANLEKRLSDSEQMLKAMEERVKEMEGQLKDLESKKLALESKVMGFEEKFGKVELGKIVVSPSEAPASSAITSVAVPKIEGKILVVNKDYNFAVINLGAKDGVAIGNIFSVYHNNKNVGDVKIEKVHDSMSAAGFMTMELKDIIVEGDKIELKS